MKQVICNILFVCLSVSYSFGQVQSFDKVVYRHPFKVNHLKGKGIGIAIVGAAAYVIGQNLAGNNTNVAYSQSAEQDRRNGALLQAAGLFLVPSGVALLVVGMSLDHKRKIRVIAPKGNEIGLVYNL
jgi:hypothetical protein